ncbi:MAG TPA: hypothetical protein VKP69_04210 [Isosphaeraceae bacterium]|nr:hypothetical protein [Isosphaeraceae bacterium]
MTREVGTMRVRMAAGGSGGRPWARVAARGFAFSCFFPYPALALGGNTGLQLSHALGLAAAPFLCARAPGRPLRALLLLLGPVALSASFNLAVGDPPDPDIVPKESIALALALVVLGPAEWVAGRDLFRETLTAAAAAIVAHALIGLYQVYSFAHDEFPLLFLYENPSFRSMEEWQQVYVRYIKRPCGLFPEASAMAASLGPWLVLLAGLLLDPSAGRGFGWPGKKLAAAALALGSVLIALSRSGATLAIMAAVLVAGAAKVPSWSHSLTIGKGLTLAMVLAAAVAAVGYAASHLMGGLDARVESSWGVRALSIRTGLTANTDPVSLAFGVGPGQSTPIIRRELAGVPLPSDQTEEEVELGAVFSLTVCYYMEMGLLGGLALLAVLAMVVRTIARSSAVVLGLCTLGTWLVGVAATTSYMPLSAIWLFLGALLSWDRLFPTRPDATAAPPR